MLLHWQARNLLVKSTTLLAQHASKDVAIGFAVDAYREAVIDATNRAIMRIQQESTHDLAEILAHSRIESGRIDPAPVNLTFDMPINAPIDPTRKSAKSRPLPEVPMNAVKIDPTKNFRNSADYNDPPLEMGKDY